MTFDPNSNDAMFARIMERLDDVRADFKAARIDTDTRLRSIESWRDNVKGRVAIVAIVVSTAIGGAIELSKNMFHSAK